VKETGDVFPTNASGPALKKQMEDNGPAKTMIQKHSKQMKETGNRKQFVNLDVFKANVFQTPALEKHAMIIVWKKKGTTTEYVKKEFASTLPQHVQLIAKTGFAQETRAREFHVLTDAMEMQWNTTEAVQKEAVFTTVKFVYLAAQMHNVFQAHVRE